MGTLKTGKYEFRFRDTMTVGDRHDLDAVAFRTVRGEEVHYDWPLLTRWLIERFLTGWSWVPLGPPGEPTSVEGLSPGEAWDRFAALPDEGGTASRLALAIWNGTVQRAIQNEAALGKVSAAPSSGTTTGSGSPTPTAEGSPS